MTMNFKIKEFKLLCLKNDDSVNFTLDWVTHGNFAIKKSSDGIYSPLIYISLERSHFKEILNSFAEAKKPSGRQPFWTGTVPPRGMRNINHLIEVYACNEKYIKIINSSCDSMIGVPHYHHQCFISVETFQEMSDAVDQYGVVNET